MIGSQTRCNRPSTCHVFKGIFAVQSCPCAASSTLQRGHLQTCSGGFASALADIDRAFARSVDDVRAHDLHGWVLVKLGRATEALASADRAAARDPQAAHAHDTRSRALEALGRRGEASQPD
jgi:tetratricopeptide (TPR) repeat protein